MPINFDQLSHLHHHYLKGIYCIFVKLEYKPNRYKYFHKIGCTWKDDFNTRLNSFHNCFPFGFDILFLYFMKNTKEKIKAAEKFIHTDLNKYRVNTTTRKRSKLSESTSEWFDMEGKWQEIGESFIRAQNKFTGWVLFKPSDASRDRKDLEAYVPTEKELEKIQDSKIQQANEEYDEHFNRLKKLRSGRRY